MSLFPTHSCIENWEHQRRTWSSRNYTIVPLQRNKSISIIFVNSYPPHMLEWVIWHKRTQILYLLCYTTNDYPIQRLIKLLNDIKSKSVFWFAQLYKKYKISKTNVRQSFFQKNHMKISKIESWKRQHSHWWKGFRKIIFKKCKLKIPKDCQKHLEQRFYIAIHLQWSKSKMFSQFMFQTVELLLSPLLFLSKLNKILMFVSIT